MTTISILGCGWFGLALAKELIKEDYQVKGSTTSLEKLEILSEAGIKGYVVDFSSERKVYDAAFFDCDVLFIAIPPKRKAGEIDSYAQKLQSICQTASEGKVKHLVFISSTGVYENSNREFTELDLPHPDTDSGKALLAVEEILKSQRNYTTTIIRFGGLFGPNRDPGRFFAGKRDIPNGLAPVNMIHLNDCIGISLTILKKQAFNQTYNACSPQHPSRSDFYTEAARKVGLDLPQFIPERLEWKIVNSAIVARDLDYQFKESLY